VRLWIDNTGLQGAGQCLAGRAHPGHEYDIRGLLQLATLLIFANEIKLNGFEDDTVAARSREIVDQLRALDTADNAVSIEPVTKAQYALACKIAADSLAQDLPESFNPDEHMILGGEPSHLPRGIRARQVQFMTLARERAGSAALRQTEENALRDRGIGAVEYMLAVSGGLRESILNLQSRHPDWEDRHSYQLNVFLRYHLNEALGEQTYSSYAPAVARAELVRRRNQYILQALDRLVDEAVEELRGKPLGVPSTLAAILHRSRGEPDGVIRIANEFRPKSRPLRDRLELLANRYTDDTPEFRYQIHKEIQELGDQLRRDLGLDEASSWRDAIELSIVLGCPVLRISGGKLLKWLRQRQQQRRTAVLTELATASAFSDSSEIFYARLRQKCRRCL